MAEIQLTKGQVAIVDDEDFDWLSQWKWCARANPAGKFYALRNAPRTENRPRTIYMHREITAAISRFEVDHINRDGLDNRRANLRVCTRAENSRNRDFFRGVSRYVGVGRQSSKHLLPWKARITLNGELYELGGFASEDEAALAYDAKAKELFGEFARPNFL